MTRVSINLRNEDLHYLLKIIRASKANEIRSTRFCRNGGNEKSIEILSEKPQGTDYLGNLGVDRRLIQN
jgi:hypothetical protein